MFDHDDTIAAIASAAGGAGCGIVRISGPAAIECAAAFCKFTSASSPAVLGGTAMLPGFTTPLACNVYVWPNERSYTRQPTVELHLPGSPPVVAAALEAACRGGARPARPGEFTLRAFLAGRLDLTQAEAVLGVVDAADRRQLDVALRQMAGGLAGPLDRLRNRLLDLLAHLEAGLDFVEEDIEFVTRDALLRQLAEGRDAVASLAAQATARGDVVERPRVVLVGLPNVGKSSLFNALAGRNGAIVSPLAGTTRDYLTAIVPLGGVESELIDTAGIDDSLGGGRPVEAAAREAAVRQSRDADVRVFCLDASRPPTSWEVERLSQHEPHRVVVRTKCDLAPYFHGIDGGLSVSVVTGRGLDDLRSALGAAAADARHAGDVVTATAVRCHDSWQRAAVALESARCIAENRGGEELVALELRTALDELGRVVGAVYTNDILDRIFSRFCIGK